MIESLDIWGEDSVKRGPTKAPKILKLADVERKLMRELDFKGLLLLKNTLRHILNLSLFNIAFVNFEF